MWARSLHLEATGAREQAYVLLQSAWDMAAAMGIVNYHRVIGADLIRMAVAAGDVERLGSALIQIDEVTGRMGTTTARGTAEWCRGLADQDPTAFRKAVEIYRESPRRFEFARLCEDAAATIWGSGSASEGSALFVEALELYEQIDANRDVSRIIGTMRRVGIRRARKGSRRRERTGWSSLTDTELRVVDMVAAGRSNPQIADRLFISRRTVESHVSSALRKLGVSSRVGIATIAARRAQP